MGITPAHAGTTGIDGIAPKFNSDHPRSRGDHVLEIPLTLIVNGSPPLTRGPLAHVSLSRWARGITPAHAGTTNGINRVDDLI